MNKKRWLIASALLIVAIILFTVLRQQTSSQQKTLRVAVQNTMSTLDPNHIDEVGAEWGETQILEGLYTADAKGKITAGVAKQIVKPTENGTLYTIPLKHNQKWSDGTAVTEQDFVASAQRQVNPKTKSTRANHFKDLENYSDVLSGKVAPKNLGISAPDKYTVQIKLAHPVPYFDFVLANQLYPVNTDKLAKWGNKYGQTAETTVANGAYQVKKWNQSATQWEFVKNQHFADAKSVDFDTIKVTVVKDAYLAAKQYEAKKVDEAEISGALVANIKKSAQKDIKTSQKGRMAFLVWNADDKVAGNTNFKKAVSLAINREQLTQEVLADGSTPAKSIVPSGEVKIDGKDFNDGLSLPYDKQAAQEYLKKAQSELGQKHITLKINTADTDAYKALGVYLKQSIERNLPNVSVTLNRMPLNAEIQAFDNQNFQSGTLSWTTDFNDPIDFLDIAYSKGAINFTNWRDERYERLLEKVNQQYEPNAQRYTLAKSAAQLNNDLNGVTPLYQVANVHLQNSNKVDNLVYPLIGYQNYRYAEEK